MSCVTSVSYQVIFNGELTNSFLPKNGVGQGDRSSIAASRPDISHLFFADDLILFVKATPMQAKILKDA